MESVIDGRPSKTVIILQQPDSTRMKSSQATVVDSCLGKHPALKEDFVIASNAFADLLFDVAGFREVRNYNHVVRVSGRGTLTHGVSIPPNLNVEAFLHDLYMENGLDSITLPMKDMPEEVQELVRAAENARVCLASAPSSLFSVGAAVRSQDGAVSTGGNVELSRTAGGGSCAEKVALLKNHGRGEASKWVTTVAVSGRPADDNLTTVNGKTRFAMPCPSCIGTLLAYEQIGQDMTVVVLGMDGEVVRMTKMSALIKMRYKSSSRLQGCIFSFFLETIP